LLAELSGVKSRFSDQAQFGSFYTRSIKITLPAARGCPLPQRMRYNLL
jgi:hypothetical protein